MVWIHKDNAVWEFEPTAVGEETLGMEYLPVYVIRTAAANLPAAQGVVVPGDRHPDDDAVDLFAMAMKTKLAVKRAQGRGGWDDPEQCSIDDLQRMLDEHYQREGQHIDCANFHMMIWHRKISAAQEGK